MSAWQRMAGEPGGTVGAFSTATSASGGVLVVAVTMTGTFVSGDAGCSWTPTARGRNVPFCEVIATSPEFHRDDTLFIGGRNGLYCSTDGGATWRHVLRGERVLCMVASHSVLLVGTELDGILRSDDGGRNFGPANAGLLDLSVLGLAVSPRFEDDGTAFAASASGLYRTRNGGKLWRPVELDADVAVQCVSVSPRFADDGVVLAGTESDGLFCSQDGGVHWDVVSELRNRSVTSVAFSSRQAIAAATDAGVAISHDAGRTWRRSACEVGVALSLCFVPVGGGEALLAGLHRNGVVRAIDPFDAFAPANTGLVGRLVLDLELSPIFDVDHTLFAAGPDAGVMASDDGGRTWTSSLVGFEDPLVFDIAVSPDLSGLFAATEAGVLRSPDVGATWQSVLDGTPMTTLAAGPRHDDGRWPLLAATASGRLLQSDDAGASWRSLGDGFPNAEIRCVAVSPDYWHDRTLFAGTSTGVDITVWRSVDAGNQWQRWFIEHGQVLALALPATYPLNGRLYVGAGTRIWRPMRNTREVHAGEHRPMWRDVDLGVPIAALAMCTSGTGFVATSDGVFLSKDGFEHFSSSSGTTGPTATLAVAAASEWTYALEVGGAIWRWKANT